MAYLDTLKSIFLISEHLQPFLTNWEKTTNLLFLSVIYNISNNAAMIPQKNNINDHKNISNFEISLIFIHIHCAVNCDVKYWQGKNFKSVSAFDVSLIKYQRLWF